MAHVTLKEVEHLAMLSRLGLSKAERASLKEDLEGILSYVEVLQDVPNLPSLLGKPDPKGPFVLRPDKEEKTLASASQTRAAAPSKKGR